MTTTSWVRFHPVTRIVIGVCSVLILVMFTGVERIGSALANFSPAGGFEAQCGDLPAGRIDVSVLPPRVVENRGTPFEALTRMSEDSSPEIRTIGLTTANFGHRSAFEVRGLEDRNGARACVRPQVSVELFLKPLTVYVAREYSDDPCRSRVIREHEERHVAVYTAYAAEAAQQLRSDLERALGTQPLYAASITEAQRSIDRKLGGTLEGFMREAHRTLAERQSRIDTVEEYERVRTACLPPA